MARGGRRPGSGRPAGARNKKTIAIEAAAAEGLSPLDYMLSVMRDEAQPANLRLDAAKDVAPYMHPKLSSAEVSVKGPELTDEELEARIAALAASSPVVAAQLQKILGKAPGGS